MRDPKRIDEVLSTIRDIWINCPDLRLCQIIGNIVDSKESFYYIEDDILLNRLRKHYLDKDIKNKDDKKCVYLGKLNNTNNTIATLLNDNKISSSAVTVSVSEPAKIVNANDIFNRKIIDIFENLASNDIMLGLHIRSNLDELKQLQQEIENARNSRYF